MAANDLVIGGLHAVEVALERAPTDCLELFVRRAHESTSLAQLETLAAQRGLRAQFAELATLDKLYGDAHHQGVVLRRRAPATQTLPQILGGTCNSASSPLFLVLDNVQDPRNFGACLRVADGAGVAAVIYPRDKSARLGSALAKASTGAIDTVPLVPVANLAAAMRELQDAGIWLTGTQHDAPKSLYEQDFTPPAALIVGNEGSGMRRLTRVHCDNLVHIPMGGALASLNVATAAAIALFEARRQRIGLAAVGASGS